MGRGQFWEGKCAPLQSIWTLCGYLCKNSWTNRDALWTMDSSGPKDAYILDGAQIPHAKGQLLWEKHDGAWTTTLCHELCKNDWTDRFAVWVVDSGGPKGRTSSITFARYRQCALMGGRIGATWQIRFNHPPAAAMRPYVKLLWPLAHIITSANFRSDYIFSPICLFTWQHNKSNI